MPGRERGQAVGGRLVGEQPVAELADGQVRDRRERRGVVRVADQARDFVRLRTGSAARRGRRFSGMSASAICARARSSAVAAAMPANSSPERAGDAFAISSRRFIRAALRWRCRKADSSSGASTSRWRPCTA